MENQKTPNTEKNADKGSNSKKNSRLKRRLLISGAILLAVFVALLIFGIWTRVLARRRLAREAKDNAMVTVNVLQIKRDRLPHPLFLPGNIQAFQETKIYARVDGYLSKWLVDIGDKVGTGQLLAVIDAPEVDKELDQAVATEKQNEANLDLARITAIRSQNLLEEHILAAQSNDEAQASYHAQEANLAAAQADVGRLERMQAFERIVAPFDGTITSRLIDIGALVSSGGSGTVLFSLAQTDPLRIFVNVPQPDAGMVHEGLTANVFAQELPGTNFEGKVLRTAGAIEPVSRTMLIEVDVSNHDGILYAGMYAQVAIALVNSNSPVIIPASSFVFHAEGPQVATLTRDKHIHWQSVQVKQDNGTNMEIASGLEEDTFVVVSPSDDLQEGMTVEAKPAQEPGSKTPESGANNEKKSP